MHLLYGPAATQIRFDQLTGQVESQVSGRVGSRIDLEIIAGNGLLPALNFTGV